jgi:hypothetical protein
MGFNTSIISVGIGPVNLTGVNLTGGGARIRAMFISAQRRIGFMARFFCAILLSAIFFARFYLSRFYFSGRILGPSVS